MDEVQSANAEMVKHFYSNLIISFLVLVCRYSRKLWRHDTQHNDIHHNDTQHNDIQHKGLISDIQHNDTHQNDTQHNDTLLLC